MDGYDREALGQEFVIDLEKQVWTRQYDVIVSFETIEHLANPEFFLENARKTCKLLPLSAPVNEFRGENHFHKQTWTMAEFQRRVGQFFDCDYRSQRNGQFLPAAEVHATAVAICKPR